ncbi:MAG: leucyl/phenylalanyl-tRNA--protein transferase [Nocardioidaceae bacterium]|nr:leucyl/phenylalanyl-tRNA--protein transferase [Nocardioidaceae bacterium]
MYGRVSTQPAPARWNFPDLRTPAVDARCESLVAVGADLSPSTLLEAYRAGLFPMPEGHGDAMAWWSPVDRGVLPLDGLRVSRSLRQSAAHYEVRVDTSFAAVVAACGDPSRADGWIDDHVAAAYVRLHALGHAHSVEAWQDDDLVGGLYGVSIGGLFAGESMFHHRRDASKVALVALVDLLRDEHADARLLDVQWATPHLASLGVVEIPRREYLRRLDVALELPDRFGG